MSDLDPRIARGTARMLELRAHVLTSGARHLGWKVGFGSPSSLAALDLARPLVGFLTHDRVLSPGDVVDVSGWTRPVLEAEVAAHLGVPVESGASAATALAAVSEWSVALELADVDLPPDDVEAIVAGNIFHRHVLFGPVAPARPGTLSFSVARDGSAVASTSTPEELTGELGFVLASVADTLAHGGARLSAGDVVITGSVVPPIDISGGGSWVVTASGLGEVGVTIS
ncbi:fumarylacetoacetate hydrolase family protein [Nocardioides sp.]|uniref:fumarylacetoacetate hydrolase family protein n=1 Tax=Nocardioides sp. TaxID=35761 RepID=UPI002ED3F0AD